MEMYEAFKQLQQLRSTVPADASAAAATGDEWDLVRAHARDGKAADANDLDGVTSPDAAVRCPRTPTARASGPKQPAVTMTQFAARQYTKWLSGITGRKYRLPSRGGMGVRRPGRHDDGLFVRRRSGRAGPFRLVRRQRRLSSCTPWARRSPTPGACTTCTATWPSGRSTNTSRTGMRSWRPGPVEGGRRGGCGRRSCTRG